jgi:hypothetical protein
MFQVCRPTGRLFYWALVVVTAWSARVSAREEASAGKPASSPTAKPRAAGVLPRAASPTPQGGPALTSVVDTVYMANGNPAQGVLVITWPAFIAANGTAIAPGALNVTLGTNGALNVALTPNAGSKSGAEKKDAAMLFLQNALAMTDAVAAREIIAPEKFRDGISKIIDGTVECLNASTWCKQPPAPSSQPSA